VVDQLSNASADERLKGLRRRATTVWDVAALRSAARAAIVMPAVFALADKVIGQPQTSVFAAFGSFAFLVLVEFTGAPRTRLVALAWRAWEPRSSRSGRSARAMRGSRPARWRSSAL
jgi:hypothetical protein